ncbi:hypothetical protein [Halomontanus rarus]|uniref:hypothetical protein n=1 Tax=Halomontanus rarus TaxID=3034020 RepID=UPI001A982504
MSDFETVIANPEKPGDSFEEVAKRASEAGMTHVLITQGTPLAKWQDDYPERPRSVDGEATDAPSKARAQEQKQEWDAESENETVEDASGRNAPAKAFDYDPYPSWYNRKVGLLKVLPPERLQPHVSDDWEEWSERAADVLDRRCRILREHGLKAAYTTNEPQVLPETVFDAHPRWRGPRVDQPNRARKPHFAPCITNPEVQELYREAVENLLDRYPEIEIFQFVTTDAGSGFCWAESLYPGENGNARCRNRSMADRLEDFFGAIDAGAEAAGVTIEYNIDEIPPQEWMLPTFENDEDIATGLDAGQAINNLEGPDASSFKTGAGVSHWEGSVLYPVTGIPQPVECARTLRSALSESDGTESPSAGRSDPVRRLEFHCPPGAEGIHFDVYERIVDEAPRDRVEAFQVLKSLAVDRVGEEHAGTLLSLWFAIDEATTVGETVPDHPPSMIGGVHQRWLTRPFVPFPEELDPAEKRYYRDYLFQARSEAQAEDLTDCQGMRLYKGWSARLLMTFVFDRLDSRVERAERLASELATALEGSQSEFYRELEHRLQILSCVHNNSRNAINYQAVRDLVRGRDADPERNPVLGTRSSWEREFMLETARDELDNTVRLIDLLEDTDDDVIHRADSESTEDIRILGPDLVEDLERKADIMNDHWTDYRRLFTQPNP